MSDSRRPIARGTSAWLEGEIRDWVAHGIVSADAADAIRGRYEVSADAQPLPTPEVTRRITLVRLVLALGAVFMGAGLVWLVASNLDQLSPLFRFLLLTAIWLALLFGAAVLAQRRADSRDVASPVVAAVQLLAAAAYGALVFQAAQSLQVPAFEAGLVGVWGLGALIHAYAVRGRAVAVLAIALLGIWFVWQVISRSEGQFGFVAATLSAAVVVTAVGALHTAFGRLSGHAAFGPLWSHLGAGFALVGLFAAALPNDRVAAGWPWQLLAALALAVVLVGGVLALRSRDDRFEVGLVTVVAVAGFGLALWAVDTEALRTGELTANGLLRVVVSVIVYLGVASGYAVLGALRSRPILTMLATIALVIFITFQAFAVFAPILPGSLLFLVVGLVLLVTGFLADRGRRQIAASVEGAAS